MRAPISVVIPTLNAAEGLPGCLNALGEGLQAGLIRELVISDGGSVDATLEIARAAGAVIVEGLPSRGGQLRRGAQVAQGAWFLFLHADSWLQPGWSEAVLAHLAENGAEDGAEDGADGVAENSAEKAGYFKLRFDKGGVAGRLVAGWANLRSRVLGLPFGDQGLLIGRDLYDAVGGYCEIPLMEDVALARCLKGRFVRLDATIVTSAERYRRDGWVRRCLKNARTQARYFLGADPEGLVRGYRK